MNRINQKGTRPQGHPVTLCEQTDEEQTMVRQCYPELFGEK